MKARIRGVVTGLAALVALALLVVGLPVVLYRFGGSPLPRHFDGWHRLAATLSHRDDGSMLLAVIRDLSWLAWLAFTASVLAEAVAAARGRTGTRLRLGGMQSLAARLVALAALTFAAPPALSLTAAVAATTATHGLVSLPGQATLPAPAAVGTAAGGTAGAGGGVAGPVADSWAVARLITVRPGDCLWSIAQRYLGSGERYPEIADLNYGRDMGGGQVFASPAVIEPGWRLLLPGTSRADRTGTTGGASVSGGSSDGASSDRRGQHLGHRSGHPHFQRRHPVATRRLARGQTESTDSGGSPSAPATRGQANDQAADQGVHQVRAPSGLAGGDELPATGGFIAGALAGSVLTSLYALRRQQRQERRRGRRIALPADRDVRAAEGQLRAEASAESPATLRSALACLEAAVRASGQVLPDIVGLHVTPSLLEVLLSAPAADSPPPPFVITPGREGMCWQADAASLGNQAGGRGQMLPGLFTAGATADGYLLLDLESLQVTGCDGPPGLVDQVITTVATELATGQWSGWYELILVGCDELQVSGRAEQAGSLAEALAVLESRRENVRLRLDGQLTADLRQLRLAAPDDEDWGLTVLVSRAEPTAEELQRLLDLAEDGLGGVAVLVAGDPETAGGRMAPNVLQLAPDPAEPGQIVANVVPLQVTVRPRALAPDDYAAIGALFAAAADLDDVGPQDPAYEFYGAPPWIPEADAPDYPEAGPAVQVAVPRHAAASPLQVGVLGPFVISGSEERLQPKQAELMLALALAAPAGLPNSALCGLLGADPDHPKPADAVRQTITRTRRRLGLASDGQEYILHTGNGTYALHPEVSLDWTEFRARAAAGSADDLRAAIALVRGQPFTGSYHWWIDIPLMETIRAELVDTAESLAEFELASGSPRAAARAARSGLLAEPSAEQLWRVLMRAEHAAGSLAGVAEAWRYCLDAIADVAPGGEPHPDTEALFRQLTQDSRMHAPVRS